MYSQISTTVDSRDAAEALAGSTVAARLAACAQVVGPITSTYWWDETVERVDEYLILFKTATDRVDALQDHILAHHSYDVPEIICTPITGGNPAYLAWLRDETRPR